MTDYDPAVERSTDPRPEAWHLGTDAGGCHHVWVRDSKCVHVVGGPDDVTVYGNVPGDALDTWMQFVVDDGPGWVTRRYGVSVVEQLGSAMEASVGYDSSIYPVDRPDEPDRYVTIEIGDDS